MFIFVNIQFKIISKTFLKTEWFVNFIALVLIWRHCSWSLVKKIITSYDCIVFRKKFTSCAGITHLVDDLNEDLRVPSTIMLNSINLASITEMRHYLQQLFQYMLNRVKLIDAICNYCKKKDKHSLMQTLASLLCKEFAWRSYQ